MLSQNSPQVAPKHLRWRGWTPLLVLPACALLFFPADWPRWAWMWTLAFAIFISCKWLAWSRTESSAPWWRHAGYFFAWPGLDAATFLNESLIPTRPSPREWLTGLAKLAAGGVILAAGAHIVPVDWPYLLGWAGMVGIVLILHFGLFHLLSCGWRLAGVEAKPLMNRPLASRSLRDFWDCRWNRAFRDFTHRFLFQPLALRVGPGASLLLSFGFSGLVHDLVISIPASRGHGGPTAFFLLQAVAIMVERSSWGRASGLGQGWRGRLFAAAVLLGPICLLFHPPFVIKIVVPFLQVLGVFS